MSNFPQSFFPFGGSLDQDEVAAFLLGNASNYQGLYNAQPLAIPGAQPLGTTHQDIMRLAAAGYIALSMGNVPVPLLNPSNALSFPSTLTAPPPAPLPLGGFSLPYNNLLGVLTPPTAAGTLPFLYQSAQVPLSQNLSISGNPYLSLARCVQAGGGVQALTPGRFEPTAPLTSTDLSASSLHVDYSNVPSLSTTNSLSMGGAATPTTLALSSSSARGDLALALNAPQVPPPPPPSSLPTVPQVPVALKPELPSTTCNHATPVDIISDGKGIPTPDSQSLLVHTLDPLFGKKTASDIVWRELYMLMLKAASVSGTCNIPLYSVMPSNDATASGTSPSSTPSNNSGSSSCASNTTILEPRYSELGAWVMEQRRLYHAQKLPPERQEALQRLVDGGLLTWSTSLPPLDMWYVSYEFALVFKKNNGHCNIPSDYTVHHELSGTTIKLGEWMYSQLVLYCEGKLTADMHDKLRSLVFRTDAEPVVVKKPRVMLDPWEEKFQMLESIGNLEGNCNLTTYYSVPGGDGRVHRMGTWLRAQIMLYRNGTMPSHQKEKFDSLVARGWLRIKNANKVKPKPNYLPPIDGAITPPSGDAVSSGLTALLPPQVCEDGNLADQVNVVAGLESSKPITGRIRPGQKSMR